MGETNNAKDFIQGINEFISGKKINKRKGNFIITYKGIQFYPLDPRVEDYHIVDIAHALSMICRFGGHSEYLYSVAQHSILCALKARENGESVLMQLWCLFHDASEAYIGDIVRPLKYLLPEYLEIEDKVQTAAFNAFGIPLPDEEEWKRIKYYDDLLLFNEIYNIKKNHDSWKDFLPEEFEKVKIEEIHPSYAKMVFKSLARQLLLEYKDELTQEIKVRLEIE